MYKNLNILNVKNLFKLQLFKFMVQLIKGELPYFYRLILQPNTFNHGYLTRTGPYRHPLLTCEIERRALSHQVLILYGEVPQNFCNDIQTETVMRKYIKEYLLENQ